MTFKHTPGPWRITRDLQSPASIEAAGGDGGALAKVYLTDPKTRRRTPEYEANARLIAAAPELADALDELMAWTEKFATRRSDELTPEDLSYLRQVRQISKELLESIEGGPRR